MRSFRDEVVANRQRLFVFLIIYLGLAVASGYAIGYAVEPVLDPLSAQARALYNITLPWDPRQVDGFPRSFFFNTIFWVTVAFLVGAVAYYRYLLRHGGSVILAMLQSRRLKEIQLENVVEEMSLAAGLPAPRLWIVEDPSLNAFACRDAAGRGAVVVSRGLLDRLGRNELLAVIAHEMAHLRNGDTRLMTSLVGVSRIVDAAQWIVAGGFKFIIFAVTLGGRRVRDDADAVASPRRDPAVQDRAIGFWRTELERMPLGGMVVMVLFLLFVYGLVFGGVGWMVYASMFLLPPPIAWLFVFLPLGMLLMRLAVSRNREFGADATAVELTRNPIALRSALTALRDDTAEPIRFRLSMSPMCIAALHRHDADGGLIHRTRIRLYNFEVIVPWTTMATIWRRSRPLWIGRRLLGAVYLWTMGGGPLSIVLWLAERVAPALHTHPPLSERIGRVEAMAGMT